MMIFSLLADDDENSRKLIEDFLLQNEETCVSLVSRFFEKSAKIYFAKDDEKVAAVFSFSGGRQFLFQIRKNLNPDEKEILRVALGKAFDDYFQNVFSIIGTSDECEVISKIAQNHLAKNPKHELDYDLMIYDDMNCGFDKFNRRNYGIKSDYSERDEKSKIKCCSISDFDEIFPLQKSYELEEVVFSQEDFNEKAAELVLKKNLSRGKIFALSKNGKIVTKLSVNARGKKCVQIGGVFTLQNFRNQGFAKKLLSSFCERESKYGKKIVLFVKKSNLSALALYKSCGFKKICGYKIVYF